MIEVLFGKQDNLLRKAQGHLDNGELQEARELLKELQQKQPQSPIPLLYLALVENYDNNPEAALQHIDDALAIKNITDPQVFTFFKAIILYDQQKMTEASELLNESSNKTYYYELLNDLCKFAEQFKSIDTNQAQESLKTLLNFSVGSLDIQSRAIELLESNIDLDYASRASYSSLPDAFQPIIFKEKRILKAKALVSKKLGSIDQYLKDNSLIKAIRLAEELQDIGVSLSEIENKQRDIGNYINENTKSSISEIGIVESFYLLIHSGHYEVTIKHGLEFLETHSKETSAKAQCYQVHELLGYSYFSLKDYQNSITHLINSLSSNGQDNTLAKYYIAASYTHLNQRFESIQYYKSFILSSLESYETAIKLNMKTLFPAIVL